MISDVLWECVHDMDRYLNEPSYEAMYRDIRPRLQQLRDEIDAVRQILDTPPECYGNVTIATEDE
jgi:hypothetical protein